MLVAEQPSKFFLQAGPSMVGGHTWASDWPPHVPPQWSLNRGSVNHCAKARYRRCMLKRKQSRNIV